MVTNDEHMFVSAAALRKLVSLIKQDGSQFCDVTKTVNRDALLALADEMEDWKIWSCTAEHDWSCNMARRIREACGVE